MSALSVHLNEIKKYEVLTSEETVELIKKGTESSYLKAFHGNMRLSLKITRRILGKLELDVINTGYMGLDKAVRKFIPSKQYKFSTFAYPIIRSAILRQLHDENNSIKIPSVLQEVKKNERTMCKKRLEKYEKADMCKNITSLDKTIKTQDGNVVHKSFEDKKYNVIDGVDRIVVTEKLAEIINEFDDINKYIVRGILYNQSYEFITRNLKLEKNIEIVKGAVGLRSKKIMNTLKKELLEKYNIASFADLCYAS